MAASKSWKILKYKELKRFDRCLTEDLVLIHDGSQKSLRVCSANVEIERVFYHLEVTKYPLFKFKETQLFVHLNASGQGFRLTFTDENAKRDFNMSMKTLTYISESPAKNFAKTSSDIDLWGSWPSSASKSKKSSACKNLSSFSQPVHPQFRDLSPLCDEGSQSSSYSFASRTSSPYFQSSSQSSVASSIASAHQSLSHFPDNIPDTQFSASPYRESQSYSYTFTPPNPPVPIKVDNSTQTDDPTKQILNDPSLLSAILKEMISDEKFVDIVSSIRKEWIRLPETTIESFEQKTNPRDVILDLDTQKPTTSSSRQPQIRQITSDMEFDPFAEPPKTRGRLPNKRKR